jgi:hypothetical protein
MTDSFAAAKIPARSIIGEAFDATLVLAANSGDIRRDRLRFRGWESWCA